MYKKYFFLKGLNILTLKWQYMWHYAMSKTFGIKFNSGLNKRMTNIQSSKHNKKNYSSWLYKKNENNKSQDFLFFILIRKLRLAINK